MEPIICFGQQPNGFFPKRYFVEKIRKARELQKEIGGKIVWFCHDSDHDYRETQADIKTERYPQGLVTINFETMNKLQRKFSPLYKKAIARDWKQKTHNLLVPIISKEALAVFDAINENCVAGFCIAMYKKMGLLEGISIVRSSDAVFREKAAMPADYYVDIPYEGEVVRAKKEKDTFLLHKGGNQFIELPLQPFEKKQVSAGANTRFNWMNSVIHCTHYILGEGETDYLDFAAIRSVTFVKRNIIPNQEFAYTEIGKQ